MRLVCIFAIDIIIIFSCFCVYVSLCWTLINKILYLLSYYSYPYYPPSYGFMQFTLFWFHTVHPLLVLYKTLIFGFIQKWMKRSLFLNIKLMYFKCETKMHKVGCMGVCHNKHKQFFYTGDNTVFFSST